MKKALLLLLLAGVVGSVAVDAKIKIREPKQRPARDVFTNKEYKEIKAQYFNAEGYGNAYNCKVDQQKFCKVKDLDTGLFILCDREVSRTQMESAKTFFKLGRCVKLN